MIGRNFMVGTALPIFGKNLGFCPRTPYRDHDEGSSRYTRALESNVMHVPGVGSLSNHLVSDFKASQFLLCPCIRLNTSWLVDR